MHHMCLIHCSKYNYCLPNLHVPGLCLLGSGSCNIFFYATLIPFSLPLLPILTVPLQEKTMLHWVNSSKLNPRTLLLVGGGVALQWKWNAGCIWSTGCHSRVKSLPLRLAVMLGKCVKGVSFQKFSHIGKPGFLTWFLLLNASTQFL